MLFSADCNLSSSNLLLLLILFLCASLCRPVGAPNGSISLPLLHITHGYGLPQAFLIAMKFGMKKHRLWLTFGLVNSKVCCRSLPEVVEPWLVSHHVILLGHRILLEELVYNLSFPLPGILLLLALLVEHLKNMAGNGILVTHLLPLLTFPFVPVFTITFFIADVQTALFFFWLFFSSCLIIF